jgi:hypothetical protein
MDGRDGEIFGIRSAMCLLWRVPVSAFSLPKLGLGIGLSLFEL